MLILSRHLRESIIIADNIKVTVVDIDRGKIKLGIECDKSIPVLRQELWVDVKEGRKPEGRS